MRKILLIFVAVLIVLSSINLVSAVCTLTLDKTEYKLPTIATVEGSCGQGNERNEAYTINWTNGTFQLEIDTGTTPAGAGTSFFEDFIINSSFIDAFGNKLIVNMTGNNLEGGDTADVVAASSSDLLIVDINITSPNFIGRFVGVSATVQNASETPIAGAICRVDVETPDGLAILSKAILSQSGGDIDIQFKLDEANFDPGVQFLADVNCFCASAGSNAECVTDNGDTQTNAHGDVTKSFLVDDLGDTMRVRKWNGTDTFSAGAFPGIYLRNEFNAKVLIESDPTYIAQESIGFSGYNNTFQANATQIGQAFLTAGRPAVLCFLVNNTFITEEEIMIDSVTFDDDFLEQQFFPIDINTGASIKKLPILITGVKSQSDDGVLEKCTEQFLIPSNIKGANDWDVNFHLEVFNGFEQEILLESDEFVIFGEEINNSFLNLIDKINLTTSHFGQTINACNELDVWFNYDSVIVPDETFFDISYCFENTDQDVIEQCITKKMTIDFGTNKLINDSFILPFFPHAGESEVTISIFRDGVQSGFADTEPQNTFTVSVNSSESCFFSEDKDQRIQFKQFEAQNNASGSLLGLLLEAQNQSATIRFLLDQASNQSITFRDILIEQISQGVAQDSQLVQMQNQSSSLENIVAQVTNMSDTLRSELLESQNQSGSQESLADTLANMSATSISELIESQNQSDSLRDFLVEFQNQTSIQTIMANSQIGINNTINSILTEMVSQGVTFDSELNQSQNQSSSLENIQATLNSELTELQNQSGSQRSLADSLSNMSSTAISELTESQNMSDSLRSFLTEFQLQTTSQGTLADTSIGLNNTVNSILTEMVSQGTTFDSSLTEETNRTATIRLMLNEMTNQTVSSALELVESQNRSSTLRLMLIENVNQSTSFRNQSTALADMVIQLATQDATAQLALLELINQSDSLRNQSISLTRAAIALEGIDNKTGVFELQVDCPSVGSIGRDIKCDIFGTLEGQGLVEKEVKFTCFIAEGVEMVSELSFNKMVNRTGFVVTRDFFIPRDFEDDSPHVLLCEADYFNFGQIHQEFTDSFTVRRPTGITAFVVGVMLETDVRLLVILGILLLLLVGLVIVVIIAKINKDKKRRKLK